MFNVSEMFRPSTLDEAIEIYKNNPDAICYAGGTDVCVRLRKKDPDNIKILALTWLKELKGINVREDGCTVIGAGSTFTEVANSPIIAEKYSMLRTAALAMGGPQIQNMATIGGNICNGAVSADSAPSLFALDARLILLGSEGSREVPIREFYLGPGRVALKTSEILASIILPPQPENYAGVYIKFSTRKAMDLAIIGSAARVTVDDRGIITDAAIALGVAAPTPIRCTLAEKFIIGNKPDDEKLAEVGRISVSESSPRDSWRASGRYREALISELSARALKESYDLAVNKIQ